MDYVRNNTERRGHPRLLKGVPLSIELKDKTVSSETVDISRSGICCVFDQYVEPMTKLKIRFVVSFNKDDTHINKKIACHGVIVRTDQCVDTDLYNVAIFFNDISEDNIKNIVDYIDLCTEQGNSLN